MASDQDARDFEDLDIWRRAYELALQVYEVTAAFPPDGGADLPTQLRRAAGAVGGHIADGFGRYSRTDYLRSLHSARGSLMETRHFLHLARGLDYVAPDVAEQLLAAIHRLNGQLHRTVAALRRRSSPLSLGEPGRYASDVDN